jgi:hypothetical protein
MAGSAKKHAAKNDEDASKSTNNGFIAWSEASKLLTAQQIGVPYVFCRLQTKQHFPPPSIAGRSTLTDDCFSVPGFGPEITASIVQMRSIEPSINVPDCALCQPVPQTMFF